MTLTLSADEALVLFEWLARTSKAQSPVPFEDAAEQRVLWDIESMLERILVAPLSDDYADLLSAARATVRGAVNQ